MLTSKQRSYLRALSNSMSPTFQIGKGGVTEEICNQIANTLEANELMKGKVLENSGYTAREAAEQIANYISADVVAVLGSKFVLFRPSTRKRRIELP